MSTQLTEREAEKQQLQAHGAERTRARRVLTPSTDIYETPDTIVVLADMPGVDDKSLDITLEKNTLTIRGFVEPEQNPGYALTYCEYTGGDYERVFTLSDEINREGIEATIKNGVLKLTLPKSQQAKAKKIAVKAEL